MLKKILALVAMLYAAVCFAAVDVNKASAAELDSIKGIGPAISSKILDERKKGNFKDWNDFIVRVKGVGENNAAKFSTEGLTVDGTAFKGATAAPAAKKEVKVDAKAAAVAVAAPASAAAVTKADSKDAKAEAKAKKEAEKKAKAEEKLKKADEAKAKKEADKKAKDEATKAKATKPAAKGAKAEAAKPAASAASAAKK